MSFIIIIIIITVIIINLFPANLKTIKLKLRKACDRTTAEDLPGKPNGSCDSVKCY